ncbi:TetR/AcrR family transcriptional regulator [Streptomyces cahuitamycinicus]|uniref:TetR family transcriptional regulator n=1 Tax=Streptomyces cahuitamycinicus TaxID=2070367 RepID=A0A2N8TDK0_9ACTN|nr:TetR/AcrR family transcriptional regulator [Streptomyces cahuitamycinicus]PNG17097.1 TetR family transcriptional regulator [Streptomyces cahuitamycinicus]
MGEERAVAAESGTRARTRRAIVDAAVTLLAGDPTASLGDVATAAGVGRTTVHRYFPERSDLLAAISSDVLDKVEAATERARLDDGPAAEALERLCQEYFELGDGLTLMFDTPQLANWSDWDEETPADRHFLHTVRRGHAEGSIDAELHEEWVRNLVWALLYTAWEHTRTTGTPKHAALTLCLHTLRKAIAP